MELPIHINSEWTLFLDRDGVINKNIDDGYVLSWDQFEFLPGVLDTFPKLAKLFSRIIVISNQQCIGKGLLTTEELDEIHINMINVIELNGGRIDAVYFAPDLASEQNILRKPNPGMAMLAQKDFPEIDFKKTIMVGDKDSDMEFGSQMNMVTVCLSIKCAESKLSDTSLASLPDLPGIIKI